MRLLITGANQPLGQAAVAYFQNTHHLILTDHEPTLAHLSTLSYQSVDLREPETVASLLVDVDAILHLAVFDPPPVTGPAAEQTRLDLSVHGTYVLLREARKAKVERLVLASNLAQFEAYPTHYAIDETWQPEPNPQADDLAPYLSEITCREFAREGGIHTLCLRFGPLDAPEGTPTTSALQALGAALAYPFQESGYRWQVYHVVDSDRFRTDRAANELLSLN